MEIRTIQKDRKEDASKFYLRHTLLYAEKGLPDSNKSERKCANMKQRKRALFSTRVRAYFV